MMGRTFFLPVLFGIFLTACGSSGGGSGTSTSSESNVATPSTPPPVSNAPVSYSLTTSAAAGGTISLSPAGTSCGTHCFNYADGTSVTLTATAGSGYTFTGWSGACSGVNTCTVTMNAARSVTAAFSQNAAPVSSYLISWDTVADPGVTGYKIYYSTGTYNSNATLTTISVGASPTSYLMNPSALGLTAGTTLNVFVAAVGNNMESPLSDIVTVVLQ
jgi:uncharacterized repeat protein (TIGR02543 family)